MFKIEIMVVFNVRNIEEMESDGCDFEESVL